MTKPKKKKESEQGREKYFMDVDRMINEGLGGGKIAGHHAGTIEEARPLEEEDEPSSTD